MSAETWAPPRRDPKAVETVVRALAARFGNRLVTSQAVRQQHGNTVTWIENQPPDAVVFPQSTEDVQEIVRICAAHRVPIIPFGTGTSLEGHVNAPQGGVSVDVRDMNQGAGGARRGSRLRRPARRHPQGAQRIPARPGCFLPDRSRRRRLARRHGGDALLGHQCVRYGTMKDNVLSLKVVMANSELMTTARRAKKSSADTT
jgi:D-lactate dehydrogenase (cytochrome)